MAEKWQDQLINYKKRMSETSRSDIQESMKQLANIKESLTIGVG
jgi:basic membrane lipoprotein Med (substrate-binding protein (PBP1-ABC) superfamily)